MWGRGPPHDIEGKDESLDSGGAERDSFSRDEVALKKRYQHANIQGGKIRVYGAGKGTSLSSLGVLVCLFSRGRRWGDKSHKLKESESSPGAPRNVE